MQKSSIKFTDLKIGITVFIGLAIFFVFIVLVGTESNYFNDSYNLKIYVDNVEGLGNGSLVSLGGLKIGTVTGVDFVYRNNQNGIDINLEIDAKYKNQITNQSKAAIKTIGLLGDKFIDISMGTLNQVPLTDGGYLTLKPGLSFEDITDKLEPAINNLNSVLNNLKIATANMNNNNSVLGKLINDEEFGQSLQCSADNLKSFSKAVKEQEGTLGKLAYNSELYNNLSETSKELKSISQNIKEGKGSLGRFIYEDSLYNKIDNIAVQLGELLNKTKTDTTLAGAVFNNRQMLGDVNKVVFKLDTLITDFKANPHKYIDLSIF